MTEYGQGLSTLAFGIFGGTPPATPSGGDGLYRSARFSGSDIRNITDYNFDLATNAANQSAGAGDSGGPVFVTVDGADVGIAGVFSGCQVSHLPNAPPTTDPWKWANKISSCTFTSTAAFIGEILSVIGEMPDVGGIFFQRHGDERLYKYNNKGKCTSEACPGWREIDHNPNTRDLAAASGTVFQRWVDGRIYKYDGVGRCTQSDCPGWTEIDRNPSTKQIVGGASGFFQLHSDETIWKYDGASRCDAGGCPGWTEIDHTPRTQQIVVALGTLYQIQVDGKIWKYDGTGSCTRTFCPGWTLIDRSTRTAAIAGGRGGFYQKHVDGKSL